jgi:RimJ/RimL family protein N-acetyltransferase
MLGHWTLRGFGLWAVNRKSDGIFIGRVGLYYPDGWPGLEVGWVLARPYWGHGYATEAASASRDYGFKNYPVPNLISVIHPDNLASQRVAERLSA